MAIHKGERSGVPSALTTKQTHTDVDKQLRSQELTDQTSCLEDNRNEVIECEVRLAALTFKWGLAWCYPICFRRLPSSWSLHSLVYSLANMILVFPSSGWVGSWERLQISNIPSIPQARPV